MMFIEIAKIHFYFLIVMAPFFCLFRRLLRDRNISLIELMTFSFMGAMLFIYISSRFFIYSPAFANLWQYMVVLLALALTGWFVFLWKNPFNGLGKLWPYLKRDRVVQVLGVLFTLKLALILFWSITNPYIDTDAAEGIRWVGLAKKIEYAGYLKSDFFLYDALSPSLFSAFIGEITSRWFDSFIGLGWFYIYLFTLLSFFNIFYRLFAHLRLAVSLTWMISCLPMLYMHVIRPGFSDLIVSLFYSGTMGLLLYFYQYRQKRFFFLSLFFAMGAVLSKKEAMGWMAWTYGSTLLIFVSVYWKISLKKILAFELVCIALGVGLVALLAPWLNEHVADSRIRYLFRIEYHDGATETFFRNMFVQTGFSYIFWVLVPLVLYLGFAVKRPLERLMIIQIIILAVGFSYFCLFTGNSSHTLKGTNLCRFLIQLTPLVIPISYIAYHHFKGEDKLLSSERIC